MEQSDILCSAACGLVEDHDHLFFSFVVYGQLWLFTSSWLDFSTTLHGSLLDHFFQFGGLGGFSNKSLLTVNIIWILVLFIIWKDHNWMIFQNKIEQLVSLLEKVKLQAYWWLKSYYVIFDFDYLVRRLNHLSCFQVVTYFLFFLATLWYFDRCLVSIWIFQLPLILLVLKELLLVF